MHISHLEIAERLVLEGSVRLVRQRERVADLLEKQLDAGGSIELLGLFEESMGLMLAHRNFVAEEVVVAPKFRRGRLGSRISR
jgi:hypothetical protein